MKCSVVIVNYKSEQYLKKCLASIETSVSDDIQLCNLLEVIVVNNDPEVELKKPVDHTFEVRVFNNKTNLGFGHANNVGARHANGQFLFFLNPDSTLVENSLQLLLKKLAENSNIGVIGPRIIEFDNNRPQPWTCGAKTNLAAILFRNTIGKPWNKKSPAWVDWVSGTALMTSKNDFEKVGGFDEKFFMYFEDQDFCLRIKQLGKNVLFFPKASILHFDGKSWKNHKGKKASFYKSQSYFFQKHHGLIQTFILNSLRKITKGG